MPTCSLHRSKRVQFVFGKCGVKNFGLYSVGFDAPKNKEATYAQCSRLYAGGLDLPQDEILITSDIDMGVFKIPEMADGGFSVVGVDLVPDKQYPICFISAKKYLWQFIMNRGDYTYQDCLDNLLGDIECESFKGNYWGKDQETVHLHISTSPIEVHKFNRSNGQNQFATKRYDRDDSYILDRLNHDTIDFHMNRPGFEENNFNIILTILKYHYPQEDFTWLINYTNEYKKLL
jgi:hypothetical protein